MHYIKGKLGLVIPKIAKKTESLDCAKAQAWLKDLPVDDLKACIRTTHEFLQNLSSNQPKAPIKLEVLCTIRPIIRYLSECLATLAKNKNLDIGSKVKLLQIRLSLHLDFYNQLKLALEQSVDERTDLDLRVQLIYLCMSQCAKILFISCQNSQPPPNLMWLELHTLYAYSKKNDLADQIIDNQLHSQFRFKNISDLYKHTLLFALTNASRYEANDRLKLYYTLDSWAPLLKLFQDSRKNNSALFKVDLKKDAPPHYTTLDISDSNEPHYLTLDHVIAHVELLLKRQQHRVEKGLKNITAEELTLKPEILKSLLHTWTHLGHRRNKRKRIHGSRRIAIGLNCIHWFANIFENGDIIRNLPKPVRGSNSEDAEIEEIVLDTFALPQKHAEQHLVKSKPKLYDFEVIDASESGFCFKCASQHYSILKVNKIISVLSDENPNETIWRLGVIRWVQHTDSNHKLMGVEILAEKIEAIKLKQDDKSKASSDETIEALYITELSDIEAEHLIVTKKLAVKPGSTYKLIAEDQALSCKFETDCDQSPLYAFWQVTLENPVVFNHAAIQAQQTPPEDQLDK